MIWWEVRKVKKTFGKDKKSTKSSFRFSKYITKRLLTLLAFAVVFATVYSLILPAITVDQSVATSENGFFLERESGAEATDTVPMPAQEFYSDSSWPKDYTVKVEAPEGALPEGTTMIVRPAADEKNAEDLQWLNIFADGIQKQILDVKNPDGTPASDQALLAADQWIAERQTAYQGQTVFRNMNGTCAAIRAFAIHFADANGNEIQPAKDIQVTLTCAGISENQNLIISESRPEEIANSDQNIVIFHPALVMQEGQQVYQAIPVKDAVADVKKQELTFQIQDFGTEPENDVCPYFAMVTTDTPVLPDVESGEDSAKPSDSTGSAEAQRKSDISNTKEPQTASETPDANENKLCAEGKNYKITVTFDDDAQIPAGTKLFAEEIEPGTDDYLQHLGKAWAEVNKEYLEQEEEKRKNDGGLDEYEDIRPVNLDDARFFNISLYHKEKIESKAPVHVDIEYADGIDSDAREEDQVIGVAHYKEEETELITDVDAERNEEEEIVEFVYEQNGFSDIGTYVGQKTYDNVPYKMSQSLAMPLLRTLSNTANNNAQLKDIEAHKRLTNNNDGTYTMSLSVKGDSVAYEEYNKANILFVMDRSSSMTNSSNDIYMLYTGEYKTGTTYYGKNGNKYFTLSYVNGNFGYYSNNRFIKYTGDVFIKQSRLKAEQAAMDVLIKNLLGKNDANTPGKEDLIEISVISFARARCSGNTEYKNWTSSDYTGLMNAINQTSTPSGTNWEDALIYAKEQADAQKRKQPDEDVYVIFLTDGEPTAVYGETGGAYHYNNLEGGFEYALTEVGGPYNNHGRIDDHKNSLDRAKEIVDDGYKFYGIFTFNPGEAQTRYLRRLMNFAYTGVDKAYENDSTKEDTDIVKKYFTNADTPGALSSAFEKIFAEVSNTLGYGDVVITDGLETADAMTTTIQADRADGFRYSVTDDTTGDELYFVTATGNDANPKVTFHIGGQEYPAGAAKEGVDKKPYYSVTANGTEYKMVLADLSGRELTWDLSAVGTLLPGCTYKVDIIVWPNQAAYDYVAGLNNDLPGYTWDTSVESDPANYHEVTVDGVTYGYYSGGVKNHPSIVKYKDKNVYSVLTNTHQKLNYSIVNTKTNELTSETITTSEAQTPIDLEQQKPMDLVDTNSSIEKQWNVDLDPGALVQLLYPADGSHYTLTFDILQDTKTTPYKTLSLGWDETLKKYVWESDSEKNIDYNGETYSIGTTWKKDFAVPTGLMLSEERMDALGMDKSAYPSGTYPVDPKNPDSELKTYYVLEDGHDYTIKEHNLSYKFDFNADVFHPMLVDGKMQNVNFTKEGKKVSISNMTNTPGGLSSLKVENTLRGYIHLEKHVVDQSGKAIDDDRTKFEYRLALTNADAPFEGTNIPWYGINGLYFHDKSFNYYHVYYDNNVLKLKNEAGRVYDVQGTFDTNQAAEQNIQYIDGDETKTIQLYGNQTEASQDKKTITAVMQISQGEVLSIANVPAGTKYSIIESDKAGYEFMNISKRIDPNDVQEEQNSTKINLDEKSITGTIVPNHHNYISYTNKCLVTDVTVQKVNADGTGLEGAVFRLKTVSDDGHSEADAASIGSISGIGDVVKNVDGETKTFPSSFETTGGIQTLSGLPDGTYRLYEVYIPAGYICTYQYIQFEVENQIVKNVKTDTGDTSKLDTTANNIDFKITNEPGAELPSTGGPGTRPFTIPGLILIAGAGLFLWRRRRII